MPSVVAMIFDTLKLSKALQSEFTPAQAEALTEAFATSVQDTVATKRDLAQVEAKLSAEIQSLRTELKGDIQAVRGEMQALRTELKGDVQELRGEIQSLRTELKDEIQALRGEFVAFKVELVKWVVTAIAFNLLGTAGLIITLVRFAR